VLWEYLKAREPRQARCGIRDQRQAPGNAEIVGDLVDGPAIEDEGDGVLLELGR